MQSFTGNSENTQSKSYMLSLTEYLWEFQNDALLDTHALFARNSLSLEYADLTSQCLRFL